MCLYYSIFNTCLPHSYSYAMKKTILLLLTFYFLQSNVAIAQKNTIDSLKQLLQNEKQDTSRVLLLNHLSSVYLLNIQDSALAFGQKGYALSMKIGFTKGAAISLNRIGNTFLGMGNYPKALELHLASLKMAEEAKDEITMANAMSNIANDHTYQGNYRLGVDYLLQAIAIAKKLDDTYRLARFMSNLGDSYELLDILDSARFYCNQAYDMSLKTGDWETAGNSLNSLGNTYAKMGQDAIAMGNYNLSLDYYNMEDNDLALSDSYLGIAKLF